MHYFKSHAGFQPDLYQQLHKEAAIDSLPESKRYIALLIDEMKIKEDLVYDKYSGQTIGFTSLGDIGDKIEQECTESDTHPPVSNHVLVLMVRAIFFKLEFPYAHFGTQGLTTDYSFQLYGKASVNSKAWDSKFSV